MNKFYKKLKKQSIFSLSLALISLCAILAFALYFQYSFRFSTPFAGLSCGATGGNYCSQSGSCPSGYTNLGTTYDCNPCCKLSGTVPPSPTPAISLAIKKFNTDSPSNLFGKYEKMGGTARFTWEVVGAVQCNAFTTKNGVSVSFSPQPWKGTVSTSAGSKDVGFFIPTGTYIFTLQCFDGSINNSSVTKTIKIRSIL